MMADDMELVREFATRRSDAAFETLVSRHLNLVYSVALRQVRDPHLAQEVAQAVFIILARKAKTLGPNTILSGWLFRTAQYASADALKTQRRRQHREQEAYMQSILNCGGDAPSQPTNEEAWTQIAPLLDAAMLRLGEKDRNAIVLRFFENKNLREVGAALGASEDSARVRISRALEKLRKFFTKRGVMLSAAVIATAVSANSIQAAPAGLAATISAAAVKSSAVAASTLTLVKGALKLMAWTKMKTAVVSGVVVLLAAGTTTVTLKEIQKHKFDDSWRTQDVFAMFKKVDQVSPQVRILPSKFHPRPSRPDGDWVIVHGKPMGVAVPAETVVKAAYGCEDSDRVVLETTLPDGRYDFIANLADGNQEALQRVVGQKFGVVAKWEILETNALLLRVKIPNAPGLSPTAKKQPPHETYGTTLYGAVDKPLTNLVNFLEASAGIPVVDRTGLTGHFDFSLKWNEPKVQKTQQGLPDSLRQALLNQLGLELIPGTAPVEMLVVEKAN
jgi:uncharacterized protein (TIGR03435 family)